MPLHNGNFSPTCSFLPRTIGHHGRQKSGRLSGSLPGQHLQMEIKSDERLNESNSGQCHNIYVHENSDGEVYHLQWHKNDTKPSSSCIHMYYLFFRKCVLLNICIPNVQLCPYTRYARYSMTFSGPWWDVFCLNYIRRNHFNDDNVRIFATAKFYSSLSRLIRWVLFFCLLSLPNPIQVVNNQYSLQNCLNSYLSTQFTSE